MMGARGMVIVSPGSISILPLRSSARLRGRSRRIGSGWLRRMMAILREALFVNPPASEITSQSFRNIGVNAGFIHFPQEDHALRSRLVNEDGHMRVAHETTAR